METTDFEDSTKEITVEIEKESTDYDHKVIAKAMKKEIQNIKPVSVPAVVISNSSKKSAFPTSYIWIILIIVVIIIIILAIYFYYRTRK